MADEPKPDAKPATEPKPPTADDLKQLQSTYDKKLAAKDAEIASLRGAGAKADPAVVDDLALAEKQSALAKERGDFETTRVAWHRERIAADYKLPEADVKELAKLTDPRDMELFALKKTRPAPGATKPGADREPSQTPNAISGHDRMAKGIGDRLTRLFPQN